MKVYVIESHDGSFEPIYFTHRESAIECFDNAAFAVSDCTLYEVSIEKGPHTNIWILKDGRHES